MFLKKITFALTLFLLTACGYHLRGDFVLPEGMENIYMEGASGALQQQMQKALKSSQVKLVSSATEAGVVIKFAKEEADSRVVALNTAGRANQFQLNYRLTFSFYDPAGKRLLDEQQVNIKRDYFNDQTDILGKSNEENVIRSEMYQQAISSIMSRINLAMQNKTKIK